MYILLISSGLVHTLCCVGLIYMVNIYPSYPFCCTVFSPLLYIIYTKPVFYPLLYPIGAQQGLPNRSAIALSREQSLLENLWFLIRRCSLKDAGLQYCRRLRTIDQFLDAVLEIPILYRWPISALNFMLFISNLQLADRAPGTIVSYRYAVEWFHHLINAPSCITPQVQLALNSVSIANLREVLPKAPVNQRLLLDVVCECLRRSQFLGDIWDRLATIIATQQNGGARIHEILPIQVFMLSISDSEINITLPYDMDKTASVRVRQDSRRTHCKIVTIPNRPDCNLGYRLLTRWIHTCNISSSSPLQYLFPSPITTSHISYSTIQSQFTGVLADLGHNPRDYGTQSLRRGAAHDSLAAGESLSAIRQRLRHVKSSRSTFRYLPPGSSFMEPSPAL